METPAASLFDGIPSADVRGLLARLERRMFPPGSVIIAEGDIPGGVHLIESGTVEISVAHESGGTYVIDESRRGEVLGEMSHLTGRPATATVRAATAVETLVLHSGEFEAFASRHPNVYRNLGGVLSARLARANRRRAQAPTRVTLLRGDAAPLVSYALAASLAWHTKRRALLLVAEEETTPELENARRAADGGAEVRTAASAEFASPDALTRLAEGSEHVLVRCRSFDPAGAARTLELDGGIPSLEAADEAALREGRLPPTTPAGRALGRLARELAGLRVGLVLGAGSLRGYAHFGVLRALERVGLTVDFVAGVSIGAAAAALTGLGHPPDEGAMLFDRAARAVFQPTLPRHALLSSRRIAAMLREVAGEALIEELRVPTTIVASDLATGCQVLLRRGLVWQAVLASMAIPGLYPAQPVGPYMLVDGGVASPLPLDVCTRMGADVIVGVNLLTPPAGAHPDVVCVPAATAPPGWASALMRAFELMQARLAFGPTAGPTVLLTPEFPALRVKLRRFGSGRAFVDAGDAAVEAALPQLRTVLPWLRQE